MRALGYFRLNATTQLEEVGKTSENFEEDFAEYCFLNLHQDIETFGDLGPLDDGRYAEYDRLLEYIRESGSNFLVAIPDASHLGSDIETVARSFLEVEASGAKVACQDENMPDPLQSALSILGVSDVSRERSSKIRQSMQSRAIMGKALGRAAYGYRNGEDGTLVPVEDEAEVVRLIFELYTKERMGMRAHRPAPQRQRYTDTQGRQMERGNHPRHPEESGVHRHLHAVRTPAAEGTRGHRQPPDVPRRARHRSGEEAEREDVESRAILAVRDRLL